ncbi:hypothetical protein J3Q64DRAFT_1699812 [Phycomyces blakesleeanus]|uniref:BTB domain-containing protein n=2 Tax=Phycomyces blakesleeanus TaxID=4837 RepID=A0A167MDK7_PHYB8|nr:hypothetical protein PHYBLDRAFT_65416 [Phycomyces blakesleeanus NRRL 1555(-)]OAD72544.1 hypothetical protein PHYBLDRAFT_65416 [Phycomyces blakesleeanus NRRL 1555(-)]|eukprot:XP_018290584.1 hypothetical protein PHYBLDRAFT_65416 [Phycomyces blakesleeanus NRRL 1555(-)]
MDQIIHGIYVCTLFIEKRLSSECDDQPVAIALRKMDVKDTRRLPSSIRGHIKLYDIVSKPTEIKSVKKAGNYIWQFTHNFSLAGTSEPTLIIVKFEGETDQPFCLSPFLNFSNHTRFSEFSDMIVKIVKSENEDDTESGHETRIFRCHKIILATASSWFKNLLTNGSYDSKDWTVTIQGINPDIFKKVLDFIYSSNCDVNDVDEAFEIIKAARLIELDSLCEIMFGYLRPKIDFDTFWPIFSLAVDYDCIPTIMAGKEFVKTNAKEFYSCAFSFERDAADILKSQSQDTSSSDISNLASSVIQLGLDETKQKKDKDTLEKLTKNAHDLFEFTIACHTEMTYWKTSK